MALLNSGPFANASTAAAAAKAQSDYNACVGGTPAQPIPVPALPARVPSTPIPAPAVPVDVAPVFELPAPLPEPRVFSAHQYQFAPDLPIRRIANPLNYHAPTGIERARSGPLVSSLSGQTNTSDKEALALYSQRVKAHIADLERKKAAADATAARYAAQLALFEKAKKAQKIEPLLDVLRRENADLSERRTGYFKDAIEGAGWAVVEALVPGAGLAHLALDAAALRRQLGAKAASGERLDTEDRTAMFEFAVNTSLQAAEYGTKYAGRAAAQAAEDGTKAAGGFFAGTKGVEHFGQLLAIGQVGINLALCATAEYALEQSDLAIQHPTKALNDYSVRIGRLEAEAYLTSSELARQIAARKDSLDYVQRSNSP